MENNLNYKPLLLTRLDVVERNKSVLGMRGFIWALQDSNSKIEDVINHLVHVHDYYINEPTILN